MFVQILMHVVGIDGSDYSSSNLVSRELLQIYLIVDYQSVFGDQWMFNFFKKSLRNKAVMEDSVRGEVDPTVVSVAPSSNLFTPFKPRDASCLLFSLQMYIDCVTLNSVPPSNSSPLLLAFQFLQYEIVVFDEALTCNVTSNGQQEHAETKVQYGKSCLFEANPSELIRELQQEAEAPLTLLLLAKEHGRGRLGAIAAVSLAVSVCLLDGDISSNTKLLRICEWASHSGLWELRDHHDACIGSVTGSVTLSCLGKELAPDLKQELCVKVDKSEPTSTSQPVKETTMALPITMGVEEDKVERRQVRTSNACEGDVENEEASVQKLVPSVQCSQGMLDKNVAESRCKLQNQSSKVGDTITNSRALKTTSNGCDNYAKRLKERSMQMKASTSPRILDKHTQCLNGLLFPRELPPPLFFEKKTKS